MDNATSYKNSILTQDRLLVMCLSSFAKKCVYPEFCPQTMSVNNYKSMEISIVNL